MRLFDATRSRAVRFTPWRVRLAGYTGRDRAAVQRHIDELAEQGIPPPDQVPAIYPGAQVQVNGELAASAGWSSGEVEFVLLLTRRGMFVGVGSDHTDRELERTAMVEAKQAFPKILGRDVWPLNALLPEWDRLRLQSWLDRDGDRVAYQEGPLASILAPVDLLELIEPQERRTGLVLFSGTVPSVRAAPRTGRWLFEGELVGADGRTLTRCRYGYEAGASAHNKGQT